MHVLSIESEASDQAAAGMIKIYDAGSLIVKGLTDFVGIVAERGIARRNLGKGKAHDKLVSAIRNDPNSYR